MRGGREETTSAIRLADVGMHGYIHRKMSRDS